MKSLFNIKSRKSKRYYQTFIWKSWLILFNGTVGLKLLRQWETEPFKEKPFQGYFQSLCLAHKYEIGGNNAIKSAWKKNSIKRDWKICYKRKRKQFWWRAFSHWSSWESWWSLMLFKANENYIRIKCLGNGNITIKIKHWN